MCTEHSYGKPRILMVQLKLSKLLFIYHKKWMYLISNININIIHIMFIYDKYIYLSLCLQWYINVISNMIYIFCIGLVQNVLFSQVILLVIVVVQCFNELIPRL